MFKSPWNLFRRAKDEAGPLGDTGDTVAERAAVGMMTSTLPPIEAEYVRVLAKSLSDRKLTLQERDEVDRAAGSLGLAAADRRRLHQQYLKQLVLAARCDGELSAEGRNDLGRVARILGLPKSALSEAIQQAEAETDSLAGLLLHLVEEAPAATAQGLSWKSLDPRRLLGPVQAKATTLVAIASALQARHEANCGPCGKSTAHALKVTADFPVQEWVSLAWQARTLSIPGFAVNAATLAIMDQKLLTKTGKAVLPSFYCEQCGSPCGRWDSARIVLKLLTVKRDDGSGPMP